MHSPKAFETRNRLLLLPSLADILQVVAEPDYLLPAERSSALQQPVSHR